jgi:hypothetical protein
MKNVTHSSKVKSCKGKLILRRGIIEPVFRLGLKLGLSHERQEKDCGYSRIGCYEGSNRILEKTA